MGIENTAAGNTYEILRATDTEEGVFIETVINREFLVNVSRVEDMYIIYTGGSGIIVGDDMDEVIDGYVANIKD